ncbi:MAG: LuxR C-terminal-related transcriptional regulator [Candidatus Limnocylindrales bacterium]|nr:LuxR C-terminal-related transcriptional regulator [Candidatus Limnocylindrales bacterium]
MGWYAKDRARERIARLSEQGLDLVTFWRACSEALAPAVPYYMAPCWFTVDPASLLVTSHFQEGLPEIPQAWLAQEYFEDDFNKMTDIARSERGVATLHEATGGDPGRSARYGRDMVPYGADQEMIAGLRSRSGEVWGAVGLYREPGRPLFDADDQEFMQAVAPSLAEGARRGLLLGEATDPEGPDVPGLIVLRDDWSVESMTPGVERWLSELPDGDPNRGELPSAVYAVAGQALRTAEGSHAPGEVAVARVLARTGRWIVLHGASLVSDGARRSAVIIEPAHPARISPLLMAAYGLTVREQDVTRLVLQGGSTAQISETLAISAQTVQQHLKSVFEKTGVRSRRDLVGKVFFTHYEPRVRDNERRVAVGRPARGGPVDRIQ